MGASPVTKLAADVNEAKTELDIATHRHRVWWRVAVCSSLCGAALSTWAITQAQGCAVRIAVNAVTLIVGLSCLAVLFWLRPRTILRRSMAEAQAAVTLIVFFGRFRRRPKRGG